MKHNIIVAIREFAKNNNLPNTFSAIDIAEKLHLGQDRKSGEAYICHPCAVASLLAQYGIYDDIILATTLLHDVIEDCEVTKEELIQNYNVHSIVAGNVEILSYDKEVDTKEEYYERIKNSPDCLLIKLADRWHNLLTMFGIFEIEKMRDYVKETEEYILPLCDYGRKEYPQYSKIICELRDQIIDNIELAKIHIDDYEKSKRLSGINSTVSILYKRILDYYNNKVYGKNQSKLRQRI